MAKAEGSPDIPDFKVGDKVQANGREATLVGYDKAANRLAYVVIERQGHDNTFYDHISSCDLELIESAPEETQHEGPQGEAPNPADDPSLGDGPEHGGRFLVDLETKETAEPASEPDEPDTSTNKGDE